MRRASNRFRQCGFRENTYRSPEKSALICANISVASWRQPPCHTSCGGGRPSENEVRRGLSACALPWPPASKARAINSRRPRQSWGGGKQRSASTGAGHGGEAIHSVGNPTRPTPHVMGRHSSDAHARDTGKRPADPSRLPLDARNGVWSGARSATSAACAHLAHHQRWSLRDGRSSVPTRRRARAARRRPCPPPDASRESGRA